MISMRLHCSDRGIHSHSTSTLTEAAVTRDSQHLDLQRLQGLLIWLIMISTVKNLHMLSKPVEVFQPLLQHALQPGWGASKIYQELNFWHCKQQHPFHMGLFIPIVAMPSGKQLRCFLILPSFMQLPMLMFYGRYMKCSQIPEDFTRLKHTETCTKSKTCLTYTMR